MYPQVRIIYEWIISLGLVRGRYSYCRNQEVNLGIYLACSEYMVGYIIYILFICFETGSHCIALVDLELDKYIRLALNSELTRLFLSSAGIEGMHYHT